MQNTNGQALMWGTDAYSGEVRPFLTDQAPAGVDPVSQSEAPPPVPVPQPVVQQVVVHRHGIDPVTTRIAAASAGIAGAAWVVGEHAHQLVEAAHAAEGLGFAAAAVAVGIGVLRGSQPKIDVSINTTITGATATATSTAKSGAGWRPTIGD